MLPSEFGDNASCRAPTSPVGVCQWPFTIAPKTHACTSIHPARPPRLPSGSSSISRQSRGVCSEKCIGPGPGPVDHQALGLFSAQCRKRSLRCPIPSTDLSRRLAGGLVRIAGPRFLPRWSRKRSTCDHQTERRFGISELAQGTRSVPTPCLPRVASGEADAGSQSF